MAATPRVDYRTARMLWRLGHTYAEVAALMGVHRNTLAGYWKYHHWMHDHSVPLVRYFGSKRDGNRRDLLPRAPLSWSDYVYVCAVRRGDGYRALVERAWGLDEQSVAALSRRR